MDDTSPTLLLTRPAAQSESFLADCERVLGRRIPSVISPLMRIEPTGTVPDLDAFHTLIVTSSHAVRRLAEEGALRGRRVMCVGEATAALAREHGAEAQALGRDVLELMDNSASVSSPCLYVRGRHVRTDLVEALNARGCDAQEVIVYDQVSVPMSRAGVSLLQGTQPVVIALFSPRSAELLCKAATISAPLKVIAISEAVAAAWEGDGTPEVVHEPSSAAMCAAVAAAF